MKKKTCSKCGKQGHFAKTCGMSDAERKASRKGRKPKSWVNAVAKKLEAVAESAPSEDKPPERSGEPFADLPPLDLPSSSPQTDASTDTGSATDQAPTSSAESASATSESPAQPGTEKKVFDTETLQKMAYGIGVGWMKLTSEIALKGGHMAIGEDMWPIVGMACSVIVKKNAEKFDIDDETGALYVVCGMGGFNGVQAGRTIWDEHKAKKEAQAHARQSATGKQEQQRQQNGVTPASVADQRKQVAEHAVQQRTSGPVV